MSVTLYFSTSKMKVECLTILLFFTFMFPVAKAANPQWDLLHQSDYDVKLERQMVISFNHSYFSDFKIAFVPHNRTQRAVNMSFNSLKEIKDLKIKLQMYKFLSNEYRYFPVTVGLNLCAEYERNSFGVQDTLKASSDLRSCPVKKGFHYVSDVVPDFSRFPPYIPRGRYMTNTKVFNQADFLVEIDSYGEVKDKPYDWRK